MKIETVDNFKRYAKVVLPLRARKAISNIAVALGLRQRLMQPIDTFAEDSEMGFDANRCIFIHVPKTGGTSVFSFFPGLLQMHDTYHVYQEKSPVLFQKYYKFAFVRNPWDRLVSAFNYLRTSSHELHPRAIKQDIATYRDFRDFVLRGLRTDSMATYHLFTPQSEFLCNNAGEILMDHLGRFENIQEDFSIIARKLAMKVELPHRNSSAKKLDWRKCYDDQCIEIVAEFYQRDIDIFHYRF